jgi:uncharacterized protein (TIGR00251 family)
MPKPVEKVHFSPDTIGQRSILRVRVVPNAKVDAIAGEHDGAVKIKLRAPAIDQKANAALIRFLAEHLDLPRRTITLERGHKSRDKLIGINGFAEEDVRRRLRIALQR